MLLALGRSPSTKEKPKGFGETPASHRGAAASISAGDTLAGALSEATSSSANPRPLLGDVRASLRPVPRSAEREVVSSVVPVLKGSAELI